MPNRRHLVLIAHDDGAVRDALQFALRIEGLNVCTYRDGIELLADADLSRAGCVIVDDRMPRMGCFEVLHRIQAQDVRLPVILLTSHATAQLRARAAAAGVRLVLEKPLLDNALADSVLAILSSDAEPATSAHPTVREVP